MALCRSCKKRYSLEKIMQGMALSRKLYEECAAQVFIQKIPELVECAAFGLVGGVLKHTTSEKRNCLTFLCFSTKIAHKA